VFSIKLERNRNDTVAGLAEIFFEQRMTSVEELKSCVSTGSGSDRINCSVKKLADPVAIAPGTDTSGTTQLNFSAKAALALMTSSVATASAAASISGQMRAQVF
jgi:hypothetical protein